MIRNWIIRMMPRSLLWNAILFREIARNPYNRGKRWSYLRNYLEWYLLRKPKGLVMEAVLINRFRTDVYPDSDSGESDLLTSNGHNQLDYIRKTIPDQGFVIDAGCNVGNRTLAIADKISGGLLLDANEKCLQRLRLNFRKNSLDMDQFAIVHAAVGESRGSVVFSDYGGTSCLNKIVPEEDGSTEEDGCYSVPMTTIDYEMERLGNPACCFLKTDVEGFDLKALQGAKQTIQQETMKLVLFERFETAPLEEFVSFFASLGWGIFAVDLKGHRSHDEKLIEKSKNLFAAPKGGS